MRVHALFWCYYISNFAQYFFTSKQMIQSTLDDSTQIRSIFIETFKVVFFMIKFQLGCFGLIECWKSPFCFFQNYFSEL